MGYRTGTMKADIGADGGPIILKVGQHIRFIPPATVTGGVESGRCFVAPFDGIWADGSPCSNGDFVSIRQADVQVTW